MFPVYVKLVLADSVAQPVEAHVHGFGHSLFYGFVGDACRTFVVELEGRGTLRVSEFVKCLAEWEKVFSGEEACACFGFLGGGHDGVDDLAYDVHGVVEWWWWAVGSDR